jgi:hypothetical protein
MSDLRLLHDVIIKRQHTKDAVRSRREMRPRRRRPDRHAPHWGKRKVPLRRLFIGRNCGGHRFAASLTPQFAKAGMFEPCPCLVPLAA